MKKIPKEGILQDEYGIWPPKCREYLEKVLLPSFSNSGSLLFVGIAPYTKDYNSLLHGTEFITLDKMKFKKPKIVANVLSKSFNKDIGLIRFDNIIFNGIIGFGVNSIKEIDMAISNLKDSLNNNGLMLIGWNEYVLSKDKMIQIINNNGLQVEKIEGQEVYSGNGEWSQVIQHCYILTKKLG